MLPPDIKIVLYGTPGQERFKLVWNMVTQGALGAIILIDASSKKAPEELPFYVDYFHNEGIDNIVVGLTHTDLGDSFLTLDDCFEVLEKHNLLFPVFAINGRERDDVLLLIESLLASIEAEIS